MNKKILKKVEQHLITPEEAYDLLYGSEKKSGRFITMRMNIHSAKFVGYLISALFFIPWPIGIAKVFLKKMAKAKKIDVEPQLIDQMIKSSRNTSMKVENKDAKIKFIIL